MYRMHQLMPDVFNFRSAQDNSETLGNTEFGSLTGQLGLDVLKENDLADLLYTFGTTYPGSGHAAQLSAGPADAETEGRQGR